MAGHFFLLISLGLVSLQARADTETATINGVTVQAPPEAKVALKQRKVSEASGEPAPARRDATINFGNGGNGGGGYSPNTASGDGSSGGGFSGGGGSGGTTADPVAIFHPSTKPPMGHIVGPIVGGVVGAAAIGGVIAVSVLHAQKKEKAASKEFSPPAPLARAKNQAQGLTTSLPAISSGVSTSSGSFLATTPVGTTVAPTTTDAMGSSGSTQGQVLALACGLVLCSCLAICLAIAASFMCGKKKPKGRKPTQEVYREELRDFSDQQPLMDQQQQQQGTLVQMPGTAPDMYATPTSMYAQMPPTEMNITPANMYAGSVPTVQNVVPMQTMPPPPLFAQPATNFNFASPASPLATTLPATGFVGLPPTTY